MGISGTGKSTIGKLLAAKLELPFVDSDDYHSKSNIEKFKAGIPLSEEDRKCYLSGARKKIREYIAQNKSAIIACPSLKKKHRDYLKTGSEGGIQFIHLDGNSDEIHKRLLLRKDHFMPAGLINSQLSDFEEPKDAWKVDVIKKPNEVVKEIALLIQAPTDPQ